MLMPVTLSSPAWRARILALIGLGVVLWAVLSAWSFAGANGEVTSLLPYVFYIQVGIMILVLPLFIAGSWLRSGPESLTCKTILFLKSRAILWLLALEFAVAQFITITA